MSKRYKIISKAYIDRIMDSKGVIGREIIGVLELI
jgi:hypothetical protein